MSMSLRGAWVVMTGALLLGGCKESTAPIRHAPTTLALVSGSNQTGGVSAVLAEPLVVRALDGAGRPVAGVAISWGVTGGGNVSQSTSSTGGQGEDSVTWTLGATPGVQTATAAHRRDRAGPPGEQAPDLTGDPRGTSHAYGHIGCGQHAGGSARRPVVGQIVAPDVTDEYQVVIPAAGTYTFETSGVLGACGWGIELDTKLDLLESDGTELASNDDSGSAEGPQCSRITVALTRGTYYAVVSGSTANGLASQGRYRLQIRTGS